MPMLRDDGGGSAEAVSGDGLIYPEAFWGKSRDLDTEAIRTSAANLRALGADVSTKTGEINSVWNELPASYVSPEAWRVYSLMGPAVAKADGIEDRFDKGAKHLETFADELDAIKPVLADLEKRANVFRAKALVGIEVTSTQVYPSGESVETTSTLGWKEDTDTVAKNKAILGEYFAIVEQITMSSDTCARGLRILAGTQQWLTPGGGGQVGVITADQLEAAGDLPFGAPVDEDRNCGESVGDGIVDFGRGIGEGTGMLLLGYNPEDGDWFDGGAYGQAWGGLGNLGGSLAVMSMFAVPGIGPALMNVASQNEQVAGWIDDRADVVVGAAGSLVGYDHATAEAGGDGWHQWHEDGVRTATTSVLNIGTFFIPGAGAIGGGAKAGSIAAKVGSAASVAAEVIVPGGSWLLKGGVNAVRFGETAVTVARGGTAAVVDTARLGKAGVLTSLDDVTRGAGYTPTRPKLTDSFNLEGVSKPAPSSPGTQGVLHIDTPGNRSPGHLPDTHGLTKPAPEPNTAPVSHVPEKPSLPRTGPTGTPALGTPRVPPPHTSAPGQPTPLHPDTEATRAVDAEIRDTFGENPYELPDYIPEQWNTQHGNHAEVPAPERVPALVGAGEAEAGNITAQHDNTITNSAGEPPGAITSGSSDGNYGTQAADSGTTTGRPTGGNPTNTGNSSGGQPPGFDEWDAYEAQQNETGASEHTDDPWAEHSDTDTDPTPGRREPYDPFHNEWYDPEIGPTSTPPVIAEYTEHVIDRLIKRGITRAEVQELFDNPPRFPEWQPRHGTWRYVSADGEYYITVSPQGRLATSFYNE